ncbi:MAG: DUF1553 domain-containing protein, partial [Pirellulales bacterium]
MKFPPLRLLFVPMLCCIGAIGATVAQADEQQIDFNRDIRPVLAEHCFKCHGPDPQRREADLRLDTQAGAFGESSEGDPVIAPGKPDKSELYLRLVHDDADQRMPPADETKQPTAAQIELLHRWIQQGADWAGHWAFEEPSSPDLPTVKQRDWPRNAIDYFILARLEERELTPTAEADRRTLIRRITLDLTGLPPTLADVTMFLEDDSPNAYDKVVDRLLASPRCGERLAVEWLDAARYADTHGYHEDFHRDMWPWRDWVLNAMNHNMAFDRFTEEQLAGDLLNNPTNQQLVATGFNRNHGVTASGIAEEYRVEYVLDRARTTSTVWLGLTMGCAQCHDHKYDPISQKDFYKFFAYFNTITDKGVENVSGNVNPKIDVMSAQHRVVMTAKEQRIERIEQQMSDRSSKAAAALSQWEAGLKESPAAFAGSDHGLVAHAPLDETAGEAVQDLAGGTAGSVKGKAEWVKGQRDGALRFDGNTHVEFGNVGDFDRLDEFSMGAWVYPSRESIIVSKVSDAPVMGGYELRAGGSQIDVRLTNHESYQGLRTVTDNDAPKNQWSHVFVTYDGSSRAEGIKIYLNGKLQESRVIRNNLNKSISVDAPLKIGRRADRQALLGMVDDVRVYSRVLTATEVARLAGKDPIPAILNVAATDRTVDQKHLLTDYYLRSRDATYRKLIDELALVKRALRHDRDGVPTSMVMKEMEKPRDTFVLMRGHYERHGDKVLPGTPDVLPSLRNEAPANRLGLANWLTDPSHPLVGRVTVNRFWQLAFGTGLVKTSEDFGIQGDRPSHPELLDYLATRFVDENWNVKSVLRQIVTSATYRQSSEATPDLLERDPENRLLARGPRHLLSAEMVRDTALAVSGLLVEKVGGPSVKPYQPADLWIEMSNRPYVQDTGERLYRRSLYTYIKRAVPPPSMAAMDAPNREICTVRRQRTSTPLRALVMMNDPTYIEASRALAQRIMLEGGSLPQDRIHFAYQVVMSRHSKQAEQDELLKLYETQLEVFRGDESAAKELLSVGESERDESLD